MTELSVKSMRERGGTLLQKLVGEMNTPSHTVIVGTSASPVALATADECGRQEFYSSAMITGTSYGDYTRLDATGAAAEHIAGRSKCLLKAAAGNAHGRHDTLELDTSAGNVTGLGTGHRGNLVVADRAVTAGTYYGAMAEIYPLGNTAALPTASNACLGINAQPGTAMDAVVNALSISGTDGTGKMIYTHAITMGATGAGGIRIIVNGVKRWIPFVAAE